MKKRVLIAVFVLIALLAGLGFFFKEEIRRFLFRPTESTIEVGVERVEERPDDSFGVFAEGLVTPWSMTFLPDGDMVVTERSGTVKRIGATGQVFPIEGVQETSEGGLLGIALHPEFTTNNRLYLYMTKMVNGSLQNQIDTYVLSGNSLSYQRTVLDGIPAANNHNGGGIGFGPDKKLYVATGDASLAALAQNTRSLAGKILRMNDDGSVPSDNPFNNFVWSYGHRNPQGITWDEQGRLWSVEHGPSGMDGGSGQDELNLIEKGVNYGWPTIRGDQSAEGMRRPVVHSGANETWAPSGIVYANGSLFFAGLRGQSLYQAVIGEDVTVSLKRHFGGEYGRLRAVATKDQVLYFSTSNRDGRGTPIAADDRIFQAPLTLFE